MIEDTLGLVGTVVADKYEVLEAVGQGGFALVYRARHTLWKRTVALKVFNVGDGTGPTQRALTDDLVREASLLAELSEKTASICQARDVGMLEMPTGQSLPYMVLEWLSGKSLSHTLAEEEAAKATPRSLAETVTLLEPIAEGLALAHVSGIAHRDVKPANIFLAADEPRSRTAAKLLDFGIAKVVASAQKFQRTAGVVTAFTPSHGAPEQFSRTYGATGPWTDVFALALVIVECITGRRVVVGDDMVKMASIVMDPARRPTPRTLGAMVSDKVEAVFARALAVSPRDRYSTVGAFWVELTEALGVEAPKSIAACAVAVPMASLEEMLKAAPQRPRAADPGTFSSPTLQSGGSAPAPTAPVNAPVIAPVVVTPVVAPVVPATAVAAAPAVRSASKARRTSGRLVAAVFVGLIVLMTVGLAVGYRLIHGSQLPGPRRDLATGAPSS